MLCLSTDREDIKAALRKKFGAMAEFERARSLPIGSVRDVLRGKAVARTAVAIAEELETDVHALFPGRFLSLKRDNISQAAPTHRLSAEAR